MLTPRKRLYLLVVFVLVSALIMEPLSAREDHGTARGFHVNLASPFRAVGSILAGIPDALGMAVGGVGDFVGGLFTASGAKAAAPKPSGSPSPGAQPSPDAPNEVVSKRGRDASFYRNADGSTKAVFEQHKHYQSAPGRWENVDLNFRADGADQVADRNDVIARVSGKTLSVTERASGKGVRWTLSETPTVSGTKATFKGQAGLTWSYYTTSAGVKLQAPVSSSLGPQTYSFSYQILGGAKALSVNANGDLESDVFSVPRSLIYGANAVEYPAGAWRLAGAGVVAFDFDDTSLPADAYPYVLDPATTFVLGATLDDNRLRSWGTSYPPTTNIDSASASVHVIAARDYLVDCGGAGKGPYCIWNGFLRWNTGPYIPDDATVNSAYLQVDATFVRNDNGYYLTADYYNSGWPIDAADYQKSYQLGAINFWPIPASPGILTADLVNVGNISKTGYTGLRLHVSGTSTTGRNIVQFRSFDDPTPGVIKPKLTVVYNNTAPSIPSLDSPIANAPVPSVTPVLKANSTDTQQDPISYQFVLATDAAFSQGVQYSGWLPTTNTWTVPPSLLKDGISYWWKAQARDKWGATTAWGSSQKFDVRVTKLGTRDYWPMWSHGPVSVNQANGNLVLGVPGPAYPTAAGSMSASASYNLFNTSNPNALGAGWTLNVGEAMATPPSRLVDHSNMSVDRYDAVEMVFPDGGLDYYTHVGSTNTYVSAPGDGSLLSKNVDGTWSLVDADGAIYVFGASAPTTGIANLTSAEISDASAGLGKLTYAFTGTPPKIASITDTSGRSISFNWSCSGALLCMTGPDSVVWKYIGDGGNRLSIVNNGTRDVLKIIYDASGRPQTIKNANDLDPTAASPGYNGAHAVTVAYDTATPARVSSVTDGPVTGQTPTNAVWTLSYAPGSVSTSPSATHGGARTADGYATVTPPNQQGQPNPKSSKVYYDNLGRTMEAVDVLGNKNLVSYNDHDQLLWSEDEAGNPTDNVYDPVTDLLVSSTGPDPDGAGGLDRPVTTSRYDETAIGTSGAAGPALTGLQASYYDNINLAGRPKVRKTDQAIDFNWVAGAPPELPGQNDGFSIRWTGNLNIITAGDYTFSAVADDGVRFTIDVDTLPGKTNRVSAIDDWTVGNLTRVSPPITLSAGLHKISLDYFENTGNAQIQLRWSCAACSPVVADAPIPGSALRPGWANQTSTVDPAENVSFHHFADPSSGHADYDLVQVGGQNLITSYSYDTTGRVTQKVMPKGNASRTIDSSGNLTGTPDTTYATDSTYYTSGETAPPPAACGGGSSINQGGRVKTVTPHGIATTTSVYDQAGRTISSTNGAGTTCNTFTSEGRLTADKAPGEGASTTYTYDPAGATRTTSDTSGIVTSEFDEAGRVKRGIDSFGAESTFTYDADGNQTQRNSAIGALGANPYVTSYTYDEADQLTSLTDPVPRQYSFTYDSRGNLHTIQMPNSTFVWQDFNAGGRLTGLYNRHGTLATPLPGTVPSDGNALSDYTYTYRIDGKRAQETRSGGGFVTQTTDYTYDGAGRLSTANIPDANNLHTLRTYSFDLDSNRTSILDGASSTATGVYDQTNPQSPGVDQLTSYTDHGATKTYTYTPDGQTSSRGTDTLSWDGRGRMTGGTFSGTSLSYTFDAAGRLRQRTGAGVTTRYLYAGSGASMFDTTSTGTIQNTGVTGPTGDLAHYMGAPQTGITTEFLYYTGHGDLAATADAAGVRQTIYTYDPYGQLLQGPAANSSIERWTGRWDKRLDTTSTLIQMGARSYDPLVGRFLSVDPIEGGSLNNYDYAGQDSINNFDLDGRICWRCIGRRLRNLAYEALEYVSYIPYTAYYVSYQVRKRMPRWLRWTAGLPLAVSEIWGLGGDIAIDAVKGRIKRGESIYDEGFRGWLGPHQRGPRVYLPGLSRRNGHVKIDFY